MALRPQTKTPLPPTPGKTPLPSKTVLNLAPLKRPSLTAAQEATLHAKQLLAPLYAQASTQADRQNAAIKSFTQAIMSQLQPVGGQIQGDYNNAIQGQSALVNAAADSLRNVNPNSQEQSLLDSIGAPDAQKAQVATNLGNTFNGGAAVGQYVNGVLPLGALRQQGLTASTLARLQPGFEALRGQQSLASALAQQSDARAKIAEKQPGLEQDWLNTFASNKAKQQQLAIERQAFGLKAQKQQFDQNLAVTKLDRQQRQFVARQQQQVVLFNARQKATDAKLALPNASLSSKVGYLVDSAGAPITRNGKITPLPGYRVINGRVVKPGSKSKAPRLTALQVQKFKGEAETIASNALNGFDGKDPVTGQPKHFDKLTLAQAWEEMRKHGVPETFALAALRRNYKVQDNGVAIGANVNPATNPKALGPPAP